MFTKERDGGNMDEEEKLKNVKKIVINSKGIEKESKPRIECLDLDNSAQKSEGEDNGVQASEIQEILKQNGINLLLFYSYNEKIVYALKENGEQLKAYMETCRKASYPTKKVDVPDIIPQIEYDLRDLKNWYTEIDDEDLRKKKQIDIFKEARETQKILGDKVTIKIGMLLKAYFSVQELLQSRKKATIKALPQGANSVESGFRRSLYSPENREAVEKAAKTYTVTQTQAVQTQENEQMQEEDEALAK